MNSVWEQPDLKYIPVYLYIHDTYRQAVNIPGFVKINSFLQLIDILIALAAFFPPFTAPTAQQLPSGLIKCIFIFTEQSLSKEMRWLFVQVCLL